MAGRRLDNCREILERSLLDRPKFSNLFGKPFEALDFGEKLRAERIISIIEKLERRE